MVDLYLSGTIAMLAASSLLPSLISGKGYGCGKDNFFLKN